MWNAYVLVIIPKKNLEKQGSKQDKFVPSLFYGDKMCVLCWMDDSEFFTKDVQGIDEYIGQLEEV